MTYTPNLSALAMRTRAAALLEGEVRDEPMSYYAHAILALPLEADPAALVAEALRLPEVRALVEALGEADVYLTRLQTPCTEPLNSVNGSKSQKDRNYFTAEVRNEARLIWGKTSAALAALVQP